MDLLTLAKNIAQRVEAQATQAKVPVAVCVVDVHGNVVLQHRMPGAPLFSLELSERKAYTRRHGDGSGLRLLRQRVHANAVASPRVSPLRQSIKIVR